MRYFWGAREGGIDACTLGLSSFWVGHSFARKVAQSLRFLKLDAIGQELIVIATPMCSNVAVDIKNESTNLRTSSKGRNGKECFLP